MYINANSELKVRVKGIDTEIRKLADTSDRMKKHVRMGVREAADFLLEVIKNKFGNYQSSGGTGGGAWAKLADTTRFRKIKQFGFSDKPLVATGGMRDSLYVKDGGQGTLSASIASSDPKMVFHVFGTRSRRSATPKYSKKASGYGKALSGGGGGIPPRDPMIVSAEEVKGDCKDIIMDYVEDAIK